LLSSWTGVLADRTDKRLMMIKVQAVAMVQSFLLAIVALSDRPAVGVIFVLAAIGGVTTAFDSPCRRSIVVEIVPPEYTSNAVSLNSALMTSSSVVGPALAGLLVVTVGYSWCFALDGFSYAAVLVGLWRMNSADIRRPPPSPRSRGQIREGLRYSRRTPRLWVPLVMSALCGGLAFNFTVVMPVFVFDTFDRSTGWYSLLYSVFSLGSVSGALYVSRRRVLALHDLVTSCAAFGILMVALAAMPWFEAAVLGAFAVGLASMYFFTGLVTMLQLSSEPSLRGRVMALHSMVFLGAMPLGAPIVGFVCEAFSARGGLLVGAVACFVAVAWARPHSRSERTLALGSLIETAP
jgi:MFS family permease